MLHSSQLFVSLLLQRAADFSEEHFVAAFASRKSFFAHPSCVPSISVIPAGKNSENAIEGEIGKLCSFQTYKKYSVFLLFWGAKYSEFLDAFFLPMRTCQRKRNEKKLKLQGKN